MKRWLLLLFLLSLPGYGDTAKPGIYPITPAVATPYIDRERKVPGMLHAGDPVVRILEKA